MYRPVASDRPTLKQLLMDLHYPIYVSLLAILGAVFTIRMLGDYTWRESAFYSVTLVIAFWLGQGFVALLHRKSRSF